MDLYEEFGLASNASPEEIRKAHRALARMLHPDNFQDPQMRALAEKQMARINSIFEHRAVLDQGRGSVPQIVGKSGTGPGRYWIAVPVAAIACVWLFWPPGEVAGSSGLAPTVSSSPSPSTVPIPSQLKNRRRRPLEQKKTETPETLPLAEPAIPPIADLIAPLPTLRRNRSPEPDFPVGVPVAGSDSLGGTWVYVRASEPAIRSGYVAEYVELHLKESSGKIAGVYQGRYRIPDKALSSTVEFRFEGIRRAGDHFSWSGNGGAEGEVSLKLLPSEKIQVDWYTRSAGRTATLTSGSEVLWKTPQP